MKKIFVLLVILIGGYFLLQYKISHYSGQGTYIGNLTQAFYRKDYGTLVRDALIENQNGANQKLDKSKIPIQEVKNLGYVFYIGEIESANTTNINDDLKNQITKIAYTSHFPPELLKNIPIIILNNLALTGNQYIPTPNGNLNVPELKADFLSEGGIYATFSNNSAVIFINKPIIAQGQFTDVLTHELGHAIGSKLTDQDWTKYYQLRGIPSTTARQGTSWNTSPQEDFAEVYKNTFTGKDVRTYYGSLIPTMGMEISCYKTYLELSYEYTPKADPNNPNFWMNAPTIDRSAIESKINANPQMQSCRRDVMTNPSKYPTDWMYNMPHKASVSQATKDFVVEIANRLNQK